MDNRCLRHIIEDESQFIILKAKDGEIVTFSENGKWKIIGIGNIRIMPSIFTKNIRLVDSLEYNSI